MRILIPTAGNRSVLINAFRQQSGVSRVVTTEISDLAPGNFSADAAYRVPRSDDPDYIATLLEICRHERISVLVPLADLDLVRFSAERAQFESAGIQVWAAPVETLEVAMDKWQTYQFFCDRHIPTPRTYLLRDVIAGQPVEFPIYIKPRFVAMKNSPRYFFRMIEDQRELDYFRCRLEGQQNDYLLQEPLGAGNEINVDFFVQDGQLKRLVTLYRLKAGDGGGIIRGQTIPCDPRIRDVVEQLIEHTAFHGPGNIQLYEMPDGRLPVVEINPRFSNSSALVVRPAGVDFYELTVAMLSGVPIEPQFDNYELLSVTSEYRPVVIRHTPLVDGRTSPQRTRVA